jgi:hypothetical protein
VRLEGLGQLKNPVTSSGIEPATKDKSGHEDVWGSGGVAPFLTSTPYGGEWSASRFGRFATGDIAAGTHWIGEWVCPRAGMGAMQKIKILPLPGIEPWSSSL